MRNYIKADIKRIFKRIPRLVLLIILFVLCVFLSAKGSESLLEGMESCMSNASNILPFLLGIVELVYVYGDDLKAKTMQMAIGTGMPRQKVVHAKWLEFMILVAIDLAIYTVVSALFCLVWCGSDGGIHIGYALIHFFIGWLSTVSVMGIAMVVLFATQSITLPIIIYIIISSGLIATGVSFLTGVLNLEQYHLGTYLLTRMCATLEARLLMGHLSNMNAIGILLYMMISFAVTSIAFKKKELEF